MAVCPPRPGETVGAAVRRRSAALTTVMGSREVSCAVPQEEQNRFEGASGAEQAEHCGMVGSRTHSLSERGRAIHVVPCAAYRLHPQG